MNKMTKSLLFTGAATLALTTLLATPPESNGNGTDILHLSVTSTATNAGVEPSATGKATARQNEQGNANNQKLDIAFSGLSTNATYELLAGISGNTNFTDISAFTTDIRGKASLHYRSLGNGHGGGLGHGVSALPAALNPLSQVQDFTVFNSSTQAVLTLDLTTPNQLTYLVKRKLSNGGVNGLLRLKASTTQTQFRLTATGLLATNNYLLAFNGGVVQTNTADAGGKLVITSAPTPTNILDLSSVALWDSSSNVVLSTTLP
jgi:hypothetical protein